MSSHGIESTSQISRVLVSMIITAKPSLNDESRATFGEFFLPRIHRFSMRRKLRFVAISIGGDRFNRFFKYGLHCLADVISFKMLQVRSLTRTLAGILADLL